jgi:hypothetical protein
MSAEKKRRIYFLGDEPDIISFGINFFKQMSGPTADYFFESRIPAPDLDVSELLKDNDCFLVFIDFTHTGNDRGTLMRELDLIKCHESHRQTVFVGLFADRKSFCEHEYLFHVGLNYGHIKGNDLQLFFQDAFYLAFDENPGYSLFARARNMRLPYSASIPALISALNPEEMKIKTDLEPPVGNITLKYDLLEKPRSDEFEVIDVFPNGGFGNDLFTCLLKFPYPSAWDMVSPESLQKDTIETVLAESENFVTEDVKVLVWTHEDSLFFDLVKMARDGKVKVSLEQLDLE